MDLSKKEKKLMDDLVIALGFTDNKKLMLERIRIINELMKLSFQKSSHILISAFVKFDKSLKLQMKKEDSK